MSWHAEGESLLGPIVLDFSDDGELTGTPWAVDELRALVGVPLMLPPVGPSFVGDLSTPSGAYWTAVTRYYSLQITDGAETIEALPGMDIPPDALA